MWTGCPAGCGERRTGRVRPVRALALLRPRTYDLGLAASCPRRRPPSARWRSPINRRISPRPAGRPRPIRHTLEFEKPIIDLEKKIDELETLSKSTGMNLNGEVRPLKDRLSRLIREIFQGLSALAERPGRAARRAAADVGLHRGALRRVHRAARRPPVRRRPRDRHRLRQARRAPRPGHRAPEGPRHKEKCAATSAPRTPRATARRCGRCSWPRSSACRSSRSSTRRARTRASAPRSAARRGRSPRTCGRWRGSTVPIVCVVIGEGGSGGALGIGVGDRVLDARARVLLRDLPRGLRGDPVGRRQAHGGRREGAEAHRRAI